MAELVTHEVEISAIDGRSGDEANHLVQGNATVDHIGGVAMLKMPVHVGIDEAEDDGLVAYECLIVALGIRDGLLGLTTVGHLVEDVSGFPVLVAHLLDILDPVIRYTDSQTVVETHTTILDGAMRATVPTCCPRVRSTGTTPACLRRWS